MGNEDWQAREDRLNEIHLNITADLAKMVELIVAQNRFIDSNSVYLEAVEERLDKFLDQTKTLSDMFQAMLNAFAKIGSTLAENNERTAQLLSKVESYFGTGEGLEHEN
jgi:ABC-type transporter Mla subunit MlaD